MNDNPTAPPIARAMSALSGFATAHVVSSLVTSGVFEQLRDEARTVVDLAGACGLDADVLGRALRFAALAGVVEVRDGRVSLGDAGRFFLRDVPGSMALSASFMGMPPWRDSWANFAHSLRTGEPAFDAVMGQPFFDFLAANEKYGKPFNDYMTSMTKPLSAAVVAAYDFTQFETVCDVGGGQGILLRAVLASSPRSRGILYDMASAVIGHHLGDVADRVEVAVGSFFDRVPAADCLILKQILHDWNDERAARILASCRAALRAGGKVVVVEQVVEEPANPMALFYDLHMQVMLGGKERTADEFGRLFASAGLRLARMIPTPSPLKVIEAVAA